MKMECEKLANCIFFNDQMESMPAVAGLLKTRYCRGSFEECARYRVASKLGAEGVPKDLYPTDATRADALLGLAAQRS
jgi:hypothetical protein